MPSTPDAVVVTDLSVEWPDGAVAYLPQTLTWNPA
jgi:hypothetical protein